MFALKSVPPEVSSQHVPFQSLPRRASHCLSQNIMSAIKTHAHDTWIQSALFALKVKSNPASALKNDNIVASESVSPNWYGSPGRVCFPGKRKLPVMHGLNNYFKTKASSLPSLFICGEQLSRAVYFNKIAFRLLMAGVC